MSGTRAFAALTLPQKISLAKLLKGLNRKDRRKLGWRGPATKSMLPKPAEDIAIGICRSCTRQRQVFLPGRICERCIEAALTEAMNTEQRSMEAAVLAELERMEAEDA